MLNWPGRNLLGGVPAGGASVSVNVSAVSVVRWTTVNGVGTHGLAAGTGPTAADPALVAMEVHQLQLGVLKPLGDDGKEPAQELVAGRRVLVEGRAQLGGR
jgi:hypothetical protein